ncbi:MAG: Smr/MutS family protein [Actinobacteria bacterium]|nr:Smr/MutS family protein [Actinomycetota bacterium]
MDDRTLALLELPRVAEQVADATASDLGRMRAMALAPSDEPAVVGARQTRTAEAVELRRFGLAIPGGAVDVTGPVEVARRGGVLDVDELWRVGVTLEVCREVAASLREHAAAAPLLADRTASIDEGRAEALTTVVGRALDGRGGVRDDASLELAAARRSLAGARRQAAETVRELAASLRPHLQESFVTERSGRSVLAVKASSRGAVPGIVHDRSASGQTLFVEPFALVEVSNRVRECEATERIEVERVLARLSRAIGDDADSVTAAADALADVDVAFACAALGSAWRAIPAVPSDEVRLTGARHPLLPADECVPIDLDMTGLDVLLVTGPNTGGKTVSLKTLGLFVVMHQCGLWLPADRAELPVFREVVADIGDRQSIRERLSTFSGHLSVIRGLLARAGEGSLVLLDEIMAGTDPVEGAALAVAVIDRLVANGAFVMATSHSAELKAWAATASGVSNAAVGFDPDRDVPTYRLVVGEPGPSYAIRIAEHLGLGAEIVAAARARLTPDRRARDDLLAEASRARASAEAERVAAASARSDAERLRAELEREHSALRAEVERVRDGASAARERARRDAQSELATLERELLEFRRSLAAARREEMRRSERPDDDGERARDRRLGSADAAARRSRRALDVAARPPGATRVICVGDRVSDASGFGGEVVFIDGEVAEIRGALGTMRAPIERLSVDTRRDPRRADRGPELRPEIKAGVPELDVRGERVEAVRTALREEVDRAAVTGRHELRIIHGHGTGALRTAVRDELDRHPLVVSWAPAPLDAGGDGVTIADLGDPLS